MVFVLPYLNICFSEEFYADSRPQKKFFFLILTYRC